MVLYSASSHEAVAQEEYGMSWSEADIPSQAGKLFVITGTGGLGFEDASALVRKGTKVILAGRNPAKGKDSITRIRAETPTADIAFEELDLASLESIGAFAGRLLADGRPIDVLINNAGVAIVQKRQETQDGFELQLGTNYLGHFALTMRLMPLLLSAKAPRVVSLSSTTHKMGKIDFDDLQLEKSYGGSAAYAQSKLAMLMFALELDRRAREAGANLISVAAHPGIARTELMNNGPAGRPVLQFFSHLIERLLGQSSAAGALPTLRAATDPAVQSGEYYGPKGFLEAKGPPELASISAKAQDDAARRRLWEVSARLTGLVPALSTL
ncbi:oxidoreductase [Sphingobium yanoikuyae]|uniref:oxidoreductase n=2 Tax=Sphingobium TaxID=165695 RepID=UPI003BA150A0